MKLGIKVIGITTAVAHMSSKNKKAESIVAAAMDQIALSIESEVKESVAGHRSEPTSVDTSRFLNSITSTSNDTSATIFTDLEYPKFLEYGTSRIVARKHFGNSLSRNKDKIDKTINEAMKKL